MERFFGPDGPLASSLSAFEPRAEQAELAGAIADALEASEHLLAEAGTGTGKSLAYLVPALNSGLRVVVSTATKALQEQLLTNDVPLAAAALGRQVSVAVLKGRQNYICRKALHGFELLGGALFEQADDARGFESMRPWLDETRTGDRAELDFEPANSLWGELAVGADRCLGRNCSFHAVCFSEAARERAAHADLVIVNHALYFADLGVRQRSDSTGVLPEHDAVVFDEAHRLEETAATWLGGRVSRSLLGRLARDLDRACREAELPVPARELDRVERAAHDLFEQICPGQGRTRVRQPPLELGLPLRDRLVALAETLAGRTDELDTVARRVAGYAADVEACLDTDGLVRVAWAEPDAVAWAPVDVSRQLRERLWDAGPTSVLVSATLTVEDDFGFVRERLGLGDARAVRVGSPFDFASQALLYLPPTMPGPRTPGALERVAEEAAALCRISDGRALVLTSSYRALDAIAAHLRGQIPHAVLAQGDAPRERLLERFREQVDSVLVATATFWQGIDVPGDALSLLVIDKLPFAPPDDPLVEARCERIAAEGGDWFAGYSLPSAVLQLRQGFGRLIRTRNDRGVVAILDPRLSTRPYGKTFLDSLPPCPIAENRDAVDDFFSLGVAVGA